MLRLQVYLKEKQYEYPELWAKKCLLTLISPIIKVGLVGKKGTHICEKDEQEGEEYIQNTQLLMGDKGG